MRAERSWARSGSSIIAVSIGPVRRVCPREQSPMRPAMTSVILLEPRYWRYACYRGYLNLVAEASRYYLGWLWWFMEPVLMTATFYIVFKYLRARGPEFIYFLIIGVTTWLWFAKSVGNAAQSLTAAKSLILQMKLPKVLFPMIGVISVTYKQAFVFLILFLVLAPAYGVTGAWIALPLLIVVEMLFIVACASTVAFLCALIPDLRFIVTSGLQLMMFCSGIFFEISSFPETVQGWFRLNPMAVLLEQYRLVLLDGIPPDVVWCGWLGVGSLVWLAVMDWVYRRWDQQVTRRIIA